MFTLAIWHYIQEGGKNGMLVDRRVQTHSNPNLARRHSVLIIHLQSFYRCASTWSYADDFESIRIPLKVFVPALCAGVEDRRFFSGYLINSFNVIGFEYVTTAAGKAKVG